MEKVTIIQPKIVSKFQCDGSKCNSMCCRDWAIDIDDETYQKYLELKIPNIEWNEELKSRIFKMKSNGSCPNLDSDHLCKIQKSHGESFLSQTCREFPRQNKFMGGRFFERILTLSCPVAANLILRQNQPIEFDFLLGDRPNFYVDVCIGLREIEVENVLSLQLAITRILQNRKISIDQRLLTLEFFLEKVGDIRWGGGDSAEDLRKNIETLEIFCISEKFMREDLPRISRKIKFNPEEFLQIMKKLIDSIRERSTEFRPEIRKYFQRINFNSISLNKFKTLDKFAAIFENYLVNECWIQLFPYRFSDLSTLQNYFFFVIMYKLQQFAMIHLNAKSKDEIIRFIQSFAHIFTHHTTLMDEISAAAKIDSVSKLLQV